MKIDYYEALVTFLIGVGVTYLALSIGDAVVAYLVAILYVGSVIVGKLAYKETNTANDKDNENS